jgi:hypothetical protein
MAAEAFACFAEIRALLSCVILPRPLRETNMIGMASTAGILASLAIRISY